MSNIMEIEKNVIPEKKEDIYAVIPHTGAPFQSAIVGITYPTPLYRILRPRGHDINVFEIVLEGEGEVLLDGVWTKVKAEDVYVLRAGEAHHYRARTSSPWKKIWINYTAEYISSFLDAYGVHSCIRHCPQARKYFELALKTASLSVPHAELCRTVAECVHRIVPLLSPDAAIAAQQEELRSDAHRIREELETSLYKHLDLDALSAKLHISKSNVIRIFKKRYGTTPYEYLLAAKIEAAKVLLLNTGISVKEIAARLCISDEHYFSTLFFKRTGVRPRQFRQQTQKNEDTQENFF